MGEMANNDIKYERVITSEIGNIYQTDRRKIMSKMEYQLPEDSIYAREDDYIIRLEKDETFKVFVVHGLYLLSKLLPIEFATGEAKILGFVDENAISASRPPTMCYLVTCFQKAYHTKQEAMSAIESNDLGSGLPNQCIEVSMFTKDKSVIHSIQQ